MSRHCGFTLCRVMFGIAMCGAGAAATAQPQPAGDDVQELKRLVADLQKRVAQLEQRDAESSASIERGSRQAAAELASAETELRSSSSTAAGIVQGVPTSKEAPAAAAPMTLPGGATLNYTIDGYYEYNWNQPVGRANDLRAYDVLSNAFSINQAAVVLDLDPDVSAGRRYGRRLDLQYGQATASSQGNSANEARPDVYRNIFQAYGTYILPLGKGLEFDFGKWASSLGAEANYTKDQLNYTRSYWFYYLPFYHAGARTAYHFNDKFAVNYWLVNGTNQTEPTNSYKDEMFGYVLQPAKPLTWTVNYYLGQDHPDSIPATNCPVPLQQGLCYAPIIPAPDGKLHIFDSVIAWQVKPKLLLQAEGDYAIEREWANVAPGVSSAPSRVDGGAGYAQYQLTPRSWLAARGEYMDDHGGLFSGTTQVLDEVTGTYEYKVADNFETFLEFRRDWSSQPYFTTSQVGVLAGHQTTAALGMVWWYGGKQGSW